MPTSWRGRTPSWKEFQPRLGFAYDLGGDARTVLRGGYGVFYDQLFQNLTLFSHLAERAGDLLDVAQPDQLAPSALASWRASATASIRCRRRRRRTIRFSRPALSAASTISKPRSPTCRRCRSGSSRPSDSAWSLVQRLRLTRAAATNRDSRSSTRASSSVCNPAYPGSTPADPRCVAGREQPLLRPRVRGGRSGSRPARADQHVHDHERVEVRQPDDDAARPLRAQPAVVELRARQLAVVGRPADRVVQRQRHRHRAGEPVRSTANTDRRASTSATASWRAPCWTLPGDVRGGADVPVGELAARTR